MRRNAMIRCVRAVDCVQAKDITDDAHLKHSLIPITAEQKAAREKELELRTLSLLLMMIMMLVVVVVV
jgi:hypothetical protein